MAITLVPMRDEHIDSVLHVWRRAFEGRTHDFQIDRAGFVGRIVECPCFRPDGCLVAVNGSGPVGFVLVAVPEEATDCFLSVLFVDPEWQGRGIGARLLQEAETFPRGCGRTEMRVGYRGNPMSFCIGVDVSTPAHRFLLNRGFRNQGSLSLFMTRSLADFELTDEILSHVQENGARGVQFGLCDDAHEPALCRFMEACFPGGWEQAVKRCLDGAAPHPVLVATAGQDVVGFTGPIRVSPNGTAGFTGIGTHPDYRRRKIGMVLFHLLCSEFKARGGTHNILHTGLRNPAQEIYFSAGYRVHHLVDYSLVKRLV
jgi:GNAT superfamily N-acetyltransferase